MNTKLKIIKIVGVFPTEEYQICKFYANYLHENLPNIFAEPKLQPMFNLQWTEFLAKSQRNLGGRLWKLNSCVAVFIDGEFCGDDTDFVEYCNVNYKFRIFQNFDKFAKQELQLYIQNSERIHVYFIISIDEIVIGTLLFQLYTDLVPLTCSNFLRLVHSHSRGYNKSPINRIVKNAWIQIGEYNLKKHNMPCENYYVSHDQRGVLSMCNAGKHRKNSTQFFIALQKSQWMDCYYVAFGQLIHGEEILKKIEAVPTTYESPNIPITVEECGEYNFDGKPDKKFLKSYENYATIKAEKTFRNYPDNISDYRDTDSAYSEKRFNQGYYFIDLDSDMDSDSHKNSAIINC